MRTNDLEYLQSRVTWLCIRCKDPTQKYIFMPQSEVLELGASGSGMGRYTYGRKARCPPECYPWELFAITIAHLYFSTYGRRETRRRGGVGLHHIRPEPEGQTRGGGEGGYRLIFNNWNSWSWRREAGRTSHPRILFSWGQASPLHSHTAQV